MNFLDSEKVLYMVSDTAAQNNTVPYRTKLRCSHLERYIYAQY